MSRRFRLRLQNSTSNLIWISVRRDPKDAIVTMEAKRRCTVSIPTAEGSFC